MTDIKKYWEKLESSSEKPFYLNEVLELDKNDFFSTNDNIIKANNLIDGLYGGNFILIKNAINEKYLNDLKEKLVNFSKTEPSSFHKMLEGCPNFHREIDEDASKKYSVKSVRHSYYFFRWNKDLFNLYGTMNSIWSSIKHLGGLDKDSFIKNTPKDGIVDRIQVVQYPADTGYIEPHQHDPINQRLIISVYMSRKSKDYNNGGTYFFNKENKAIEVEDSIEIGDVGIFYGSLKHAVSPVTINSNNNLNKKISGRWWIGLYSPETDHVINRHTSNPTK